VLYDTARHRQDLQILWPLVTEVHICTASLTCKFRTKWKL
jgi:hypothetical protein